MFSTGDSISNTAGFSSSAVFFALLVIKCGFVNPFSYCTPSTNSISVSGKDECSIITTPVSPTDLNASPIIFPRVGSLFVDIVAI